MHAVSSARNSASEWVEKYSGMDMPARSTIKSSESAKRRPVCSAIDEGTASRRSSGRIRAMPPSATSTETPTPHSSIVPSARRTPCSSPAPKASLIITPVPTHSPEMASTSRFITGLDALTAASASALIMRPTIALSTAL